MSDNDCPVVEMPPAPAPAVADPTPRPPATPTGRPTSRGAAARTALAAAGGGGITPRPPRPPANDAAPPIGGERLLSVEEVAAQLGTTVRFPRRLIEERRIAFVRVGRHVRIAESVLTEYIRANTIIPASCPTRPRSAI